MVPVLGRPDLYPNSLGYGQVKPVEIFNGGEAESAVTDIVWNSWGVTDAMGSGKGYYHPPSGSASEGQIEPVDIEAFNLGTCQGTYMYQAIEEWFAQEGQSFNPTSFENTCTGQGPLEGTGG